MGEGTGMKLHCPWCRRDVRTKAGEDGAEVYFRHRVDTYISYRGYRSDFCINSDEPIRQPYRRDEHGQPKRAAGRAGWRLRVSTADDPPDLEQDYPTLTEARSHLHERIKHDFSEAECTDCRAQARDALRELSRFQGWGEFFAQIDGDDYRLEEVTP
jgi:hypothetical protein